MSVNVIVISGLRRFLTLSGLNDSKLPGSQPIEITPFRLTRPFALAYTRLTAQDGGFRLVAATKNVMGLIASLFRFLFWVVVLSWSISLLRRFFGWLFKDAAQSQPSSPEAMPTTPASKRLVRDPMCGMHVAEELAVAVRSGSEVLHFCSPACRDAYLRSTQKMAANG